MKETLLRIIGNKFILYGLISIIIIFILIVIITKLRKTNNYYERARNLNKKAEYFHILGKNEKSQNLNEKAEELRIKAKEPESWT